METLKLFISIKKKKKKERIKTSLAFYEIFIANGMFDEIEISSLPCWTYS
jgi:hypothetical protein